MTDKEKEIEAKVNRIIDLSQRLHFRMEDTLSITVLRQISDIFATAVEARNILRKQKKEDGND